MLLSNEKRAHTGKVSFLQEELKNLSERESQRRPVASESVAQLILKPIPHLGKTPNEKRTHDSRVLSKFVKRNVGYASPEDSGRQLRDNRERLEKLLRNESLKTVEPVSLPPIR